MDGADKITKCHICKEPQALGKFRTHYNRKKRKLFAVCYTCYDRQKTDGVPSDTSYCTRCNVYHGQCPTPQQIKSRRNQIKREWDDSETAKRWQHFPRIPAVGAIPIDWMGTE